jgi:hypothetical protein
VAAALLASWICVAAPGAFPALAGSAITSRLADYDAEPTPKPRVSFPIPGKGAPRPSIGGYLMGVLALIWLGLAVVMGGLFASKGHTFWAGFLMSLLTSPLFAFGRYLFLPQAFPEEVLVASGMGGSTVCAYCGGVLQLGESLCDGCGKLQPG